MKILVKTSFGFEDLLVAELEAIGAQDILKLNRAVMCEGDQRVLYRANYELRTALRVLVQIHTFTAANDNQLYQQIYKYDWSQHLKLEQTFAIDSVVNSDYFNHSKFVSLKSKDAIVDQFRNKSGKRPSVDIEEPDIRFSVFANQKEFSLYLDSSGVSLHRRNYRIQGHMAPLNEVLAAGMIMLTDWKGDVPFIDLMCGTGTLLMEACLIATNTPPGYKRRGYSFQNWPDYNKELFQQIRTERNQKIVKPKVKIVGIDNSAKSIDICQDSIREYGFSEYIQLRKHSFDKYKPAFDDGIVVMNPPYGERIGENEEINTLYAEIGDHWKKNFSGFDAWLISSNFQALKRIGLRPSRKIVLFNGALECKFQKYSLYSGTKKIHKQLDN